MRIISNKSIVLICFLFMITKYSSQSQTYGLISYNKAVNISGKQRMLSQKMAKAFLFLAHGVDNTEIKKELSSSKFIFEKQLQIIKENGKKSSAIKLLVKQTEKLWYNFKGLISAEPTLENARKVLDLNTDLLKSCHQIVMQIESLSSYSSKYFNNYDQEAVIIVNKSGKQRMLSQRLGLYYLACTLFPKEMADYRGVLKETFEEFDYAIGYLLISSYNTTESEEEIGEIMGIWENYVSNKKEFYNGKFDLVDVFKTTNNLTKRFNKITGIYEVVAKNRL